VISASLPDDGGGGSRLTSIELCGNQERCVVGGWAAETRRGCAGEASAWMACGCTQHCGFLAGGHTGGSWPARAVVSRRTSSVPACFGCSLGVPELLQTAGRFLCMNTSTQMHTHICTQPGMLHHACFCMPRRGIKATSFARQHGPVSLFLPVLS